MHPSTRQWRRRLIVEIILLAAFFWASVAVFFAVEFGS